MIPTGWMDENSGKPYKRVTLVARSYILGESCETIKSLLSYSQVALKGIDLPFPSEVQKTTVVSTWIIRREIK